MQIFPSRLHFFQVLLNSNSQKWSGHKSELLVWASLALFHGVCSHNVSSRLQGIGTIYLRNTHAHAHTHAPLLSQTLRHTHIHADKDTHAHIYTHIVSVSRSICFTTTSRGSRHPEHLFTNHSTRPETQSRWSEREMMVFRGIHAASVIYVDPLGQSHRSRLSSKPCGRALFVPVH